MELRVCPQGPVSSDLHRRRGDWKAADADLAFAIAKDPDFPGLLSLRSGLNIRQGRWKEAVPDARRFVELYPHDHVPCCELAVLCLFTGDQAGYRAVSQDMLKRWGDETEPLACERIAKVCCLLPPEHGDVSRIRLMVQRAQHLTQSAPEISWLAKALLIARGMAEYRGGQFSPAIESLVDSRGEKGSVGCWDATSLGYQAMAHHQQGNRGSATVCLNRARNLVFTECLSGLGDDFPHSWWDWMIAIEAYTEALHLIEKTDQSVAKAEMLALLEAAKVGPGTGITGTTKLLARYPDNLPLLRERANLWARTRQWKEAASDLTKVVNLDPDDHLATLRLAYVLQETDLPAYRETCRTLQRKHVNEPTNPLAFVRSVEASLIHSEPLEDPKALAAQAEVFLRPETTGRAQDQAEFLLGLACLRAGRLDDAVQRLETVHTAIAGDKQVFPKALCALALARARQDQKDLARVHLKEAAEIMSRTPPGKAKDDLGPDWHDWLLCDILRREAEAVLKTAPTKPSPASAKDKPA